MPITSRLACMAVLAAATAGAAPAYAATLDTWVGNVAGAGNGDINAGCTTYGQPASLGFFTFNGFGLPAGGVAACGYTGGLAQQTASTGPLMQTAALGPVGLGNASGIYDGNGSAVASYGSLGASAHANISGGLATNPTALFQSTAAARFSDTLTATSPLVADGSNGFIRYSFRVSGQLSALGTPAAYFFGETYMVLDVQQGGGPVYEVLNATVRRGSVGRISNGTPPAGWTTSDGSLGGSSTFLTLALPMVWGQAFDLNVGLMVWAYGTADTDFLHTATLTGVTLMDDSQQPVADFTLAAASGTDYVNAVPEPASAALLLAGLGAVGWRLRGRRA